MTTEELALAIEKTTPISYKDWLFIADVMDEQIFSGLMFWMNRDHYERKDWTIDALQHWNIATVEQIKTSARLVRFLEDKGLWR